MNKILLIISLIMLMLLQHPVYAQFMHKLDFRGNIQAHAFLNDSSRN